MDMSEQRLKTGIVNFTHVFETLEILHGKDKMNNILK